MKRMEECEILPNVFVKDLDGIARFERVRSGKFTKFEQLLSLEAWISCVRSGEINAEEAYDVILRDGYNIFTSDSALNQKFDIIDCSEIVKVVINDFFINSIFILEIYKGPLVETLNDVSLLSTSCRKVHFGLPGEHSRFGVSIDMSKWITSKDIANSLSVGLCVELPTFNDQSEKATLTMSSSIRVPHTKTDMEDNSLLYQSSRINRETLFSDESVNVSIPNNTLVIGENILVLLDEKPSTALAAKKLIEKHGASTFIIEVGLFRIGLKSEFRKLCSVDVVMDLVGDNPLPDELEAISKKMCDAVEKLGKSAFVIFGAEIFRNWGASGEAIHLQHFLPYKDVDIVASCSNNIDTKIDIIRSVFGADRKLQVYLVNFDPDKADSLSSISGQGQYCNVELY